MRLAASVVLVAAIAGENLSPERVPSLPLNPNLLLAVALSLYGAAHWWKMRTIEYALVALSKRKGPLRSEGVRSVHDLAETHPVKALSFEFVIVAGEAGFTDDAAELAEALGMRCYHRRGATFEPQVRARSRASKRGDE
jgi:hypothetical protein